MVLLLQYRCGVADALGVLNSEGSLAANLEAAKRGPDRNFFVNFLVHICIYEYICDAKIHNLWIIQHFVDKKINIL